MVTQDIRLPQGWYIGVDEAGRGCLAGPVVAGALLAPPGFDFASAFPGLTDSKALSEPRREKLRELIRSSGLYWAVGFSWPEEVDRVNILNATFRAMSRAVGMLLLKLERRAPELAALAAGDSGFCLAIDGSQSIPPPQWLAARPKACALELPRQRAVIRGDALVPAISAASILAKTQRDLCMRSLEKRYPGYGFAKHKGYGTKEHMEAVRRNGLSPLHRKSFCRFTAEPDQFSLL